MTERSSTISPVCMDTLTLRRIAGVMPDQAFTLSNLPPGLVILHGPNGSGKSTTAQAIQELLWPEKNPGSFQELSARVTQGEEAWELDVHGTTLTALQGTSAVPHPNWAPSELRGRYSWSLNGLLRAEDADVATTLAAEMAGGIDFAALAGSLGWNKEPSSPQKKARELKEREREIRSLKNVQEALRKQAETLRTLEKQRDEAVRQRDRLPLLQAARAALAKQAEGADLERSLQEFSEAAKQVHPGDAQRLSTARIKSEQARIDLRDLERDRSNALHTNPFPDLTCEDEALERIHQKLEQTENHWREAFRERQDTELDLATLETGEARLRSRLGITDPGSIDLEGYELPEIRSWVEAVLEVEQRVIELQAAERELALHPDHPLLDPALVSELRVDVRRLREHLEGMTRRGTIPFWVAVAILTTVLGMQTQAEALPLAWMAAIPALAVVPLLWELLSKGLLIKRIAQGLPEELQLSEVTPLTVRGLQAKLDQMDREPELRRRLENATRSHQQSTRILEAQEERVEALGIDPRPSREWCRNFLEDLQTWRNATDDVEKINRVLTEKEKRLDQLLGIFQNLWSEVGITPEEEDPVAESVDVRNRISKTLSTRQHLRLLDQQEQDLQIRRDESDQEMQLLLKRLHLEEATPEQLQDLETEHTRWQELFRKSEAVQQRISELRTQVQDQDASLLDREDPALASLEAESREAAVREEELRDHITRLTQQIELAREGRSLHQAMEERDAAKAELMEERARMAAQLAGRALIDWLQESCRISEQPAALQEANRLLADFTQGQLALTLDHTTDGHVFLAGRPGETPRELKLLSTGERTQVLMAVRLAFLKRNERAPLPLLVDEVLGTSDDARAEAIMQTLLRVAQEGRQIFYVTAQTDEVAKWNKALEQNPEVPHTLIDLHALRTSSPVTPIELPEVEPSSTPTLDRQPNESRADWASRLGVPAWRGHDPIERVPLFLLLEDEEEALVRCFQHRITTWGPLKNLIDQGAADTLISRKVGQKLKARTAVLKALAAAWQIGRPPAVDPAEVMNSGIVTDAFAEDVLRILKEKEYRAVTFLQALENKAVPRWRQDNTDQLRNLFYEQGTLTDEEPLKEEDMISRAMIDLQKQDTALVPEPADWQRMIAVLLSE